MATVTGMTAAAMQAIRNGTVVGAAFDSANHLILTKYDGTQIDGGVLFPATTGQAGIVELATAAETQSGSDNTRAVTPAGLASLPGYRTQLLAMNSIAQTSGPAAWPYGTALMPVDASSGWSPNSGVGMVVTDSFDTTHTVQTFYANSGGGTYPKVWTRSYNTTGGWSTWAQYMTVYALSPAGFTQSTAFSSYPVGWSRAYYTTTNSTAWDFSGKAGEVLTFVDGSDYARQTWTSHVGGTSNVPETWVRTANAANGWSSWRKLSRDAVLPDPISSVNNAAATVTQTSTWADHPANTTQTLVLPYDCIVQVEYHAWLAITYVDAPSTVRTGISHNGTAPEGSLGSAWGNVLYESTQGTVGGGGQHGFSATVKLPAGTHTFKVQAYKTGTGAAQVNYWLMRITPIRWAE